MFSSQVRLTESALDFEGSRRKSQVPQRQPFQNLPSMTSFPVIHELNRDRLRPSMLATTQKEMDVNSC